MKTALKSTSSIWNTLYANDFISLILHKDSVTSFRADLSRYKHRVLKDSDDDTRLRFAITERIGDENYVDIYIELIAAGDTIYGIKIPDNEAGTGLEEKDA